MDIQILIGHEAGDAARPESWTCLRWNSGQETIRRLAAAYEGMPDLLQLLVLLYYYDEIPGSTISEMLQLPEGEIAEALEKAERIFHDSAGTAVTESDIQDMLEEQIRNFEIPEDVVERIRDLLSEYY